MIKIHYKVISVLNRKYYETESWFRERKFTAGTYCNFALKPLNSNNPKLSEILNIYRGG